MITTETSTKSFAYMRKVKCARHYVLKPGCEPFVLERIPALKAFRENDPDIKRMKVKLWRPKKDRFGNKIQDFRSYYQPELPAELARETIYDPLNPICNQCKKCANK